jgi:hypothetical protein
MPSGLAAWARSCLFRTRELSPCRHAGGHAPPCVSAGRLLLLAWDARSGGARGGMSWRAAAWAHVAVCPHPAAALVALDDRLRPWRPALVVAVGPARVGVVVHGAPSRVGRGHGDAVVCAHGLVAVWRLLPDILRPRRCGHCALPGCSSPTSNEGLGCLTRCPGPASRLRTIRPSSQSWQGPCGASRARPAPGRCRAAPASQAQAPQASRRRHGCRRMRTRSAP